MLPPTEYNSFCHYHSSDEDSLDDYVGETRLERKRYQSKYREAHRTGGTGELERARHVFKRAPPAPSFGSLCGSTDPLRMCKGEPGEKKCLSCDMHPAIEWAHVCSEAWGDVRGLCYGCAHQIYCMECVAAGCKPYRACWADSNLCVHHREINRRSYDK